MKSKKVLKRIGWTISTLLGGILLALILVPFVFKNEIIESFRNGLNQQLNAEVKWKEANVNLIRHFPNLSFQARELDIVGLDSFSNDTLLKANELSIELDIFSVINKERVIEVNDIVLSEPNLKLWVRKDGRENYDIIKKDTSNTDDFQLFGKLKSYRVINGHISYLNEANDVKFDAVGIEHQGSGDFSLEDFVLSTETEIKDLTVKGSGFTYLDHINANAESDIQVNLKEKQFSFSESTLILNKLELNAEGLIDYSNNDALVLDIRAKSSGEDFASFYSVIPSLYKSNINQVELSGFANVAASLNGEYISQKSVFPLFTIESRIERANILRKDNGKGIRDLHANLLVRNAKKDLGSTRISLNDMKMLLEGQVVKGYLNLSDLLSDLKIDTQLDGVVDLASIQRLFPNKKFERMEGVLAFNGKLNARKSQVLQKDYKNLNAEGSISGSDLLFSQKGTPQTSISSLEGSLAPSKLNLNLSDAKIGSSDANIDIEVNNPVAYLFESGAAQINIAGASKRVDLNEWNASSSTGEQPIENRSTSLDFLDSIQTIWDISIEDLVYKDKSIEEVSLKGRYNEGILNINNFSGVVSASPFAITARLENLPRYISDGKNLRGDVNLSAARIDTDDWLTKSDNKNDSSHYVVPKDLDISLETRIDELLYDGINFNDFRGTVRIADEKAELKNVFAKVFGGSVKLDGYYESKNPEKPSFALTYDIERFGFQQAFQKVNTFQLMAPIVKYIEGVFNSKFAISGELGKNRLPKLSTLTAVGFLETREGQFKTWQGIEKLANKLNVPTLESVPLKNSINFFELVEGVLKFDEFKLEHNGMILEISGGHSFNKQIGYYINAKIPKSLIKNSASGTAVVSGMEFLNREAAKLGIDLASGENVELEISLTGTYANPIYKIRPKLSNQSIGDMKQVLEDKAVDKFNETKQKLEDTVRTRIDTIRKQVSDTIRKKTDVVKDSAKKIVVKKADDIITKGTEVLGQETKERLDSIFGTGKVDSVKVIVGKRIEDIFKMKKKKKKN